MAHYETYVLFVSSTSELSTPAQMFESNSLRKTNFSPFTGSGKISNNFNEKVKEIPNTLFRSFQF